MYAVVSKACAGNGDLNLGMSIHGSLLKFGFDENYPVLNSSAHMCCSCEGGTVLGRKVFDEMTLFLGARPNEITMAAVFVCLY
ncbi:hypothetical protein V6N13_145009 [Hibiscus sabdariffa]|uniref:Pentatricopeptide repeat-containing protein n=1 Tax=Hibiscus sabdariffa TaxID=183260 RepID=A0ABR2FMS9_9ROSI